MSAFISHQRQLLGMAMHNVPGWSEECHRDLLRRHGGQFEPARGRVSATTMSGAAIGAVLAEYEHRGWPRKRGYGQKATGGRKPVPADIAHIVRLWGRLGQSGKVKTPTRPALLSFCERQIGISVHTLDELDVSQRQKLIESLKSWLARPEK